MKAGLQKNTYNISLCVVGIMLLMSSCEHDEAPAIEYPATGFYGDKILSKDQTTYTNMDNSLQAKIPTGQKLKIIITGLAVSYPAGIWSYGGTSNWVASKFDLSTNQQTFFTIDGGLTSTLLIQMDKGTFQVDYYENDSSSPTSTKTIEVIY